MDTVITGMEQTQKDAQEKEWMALSVILEHMGEKYQPELELVRKRSSNWHLGEEMTLLYVKQYKNQLRLENMTGFEPDFEQQIRDKLVAYDKWVVESDKEWKKEWKIEKKKRDKAEQERLKKEQEEIAAVNWKEFIGKKTITFRIKPEESGLVEQYAALSKERREEFMRYASWILQNLVREDCEDSDD